MYKLQFLENKSKYFANALEMAKEVGGSFKNGVVTIEITDILNGYSQIRQIFSYIQNWKSVSATYKGKPVHPYQFLLHVHWIGDCYDSRQKDKNCGAGWECIKVDNLRYHIPETYYKSHKFWYQFGKWEGYKWIIDKVRIYAVLMEYAESKGITTCPFFDETKLQKIVENLPSYLVPDNVVFEMIYKEKYVEGEMVQVPYSIRHLERIGKSGSILYTRSLPN